MNPVWWNPYSGLPLPVQLLMWSLLVVTLVTFAAVSVLLLYSRAELHRQRRRSTAIDESGYLWVYLVPALNEQVTIADSVQRLVAVQASQKVILVIDDGSDDRTPEILAGIEARVPNLVVLRRELPNARKGKSAGLDNAWQFIHDRVLTDPRYSGWSPDQVIVGVVDADGRIQPDAPRVLAGVFSDERVGGCQCLVRIYNRGRFLTWAQDVEFGVTALAYQLGRSSLGTANMGGNSQYMRLRTLDELAVTDELPPGIERGPWKDRLTEDQDIGVRAIHLGWRGAQTVLTHVDQQGVTNLRRLFWQRVRWAQGAWQCVGHVRDAGQAQTSWFGRVDHAIYLLMPVVNLLMGIGLVLALGLWVFGSVPFYSAWWPAVVFFLIVGLFPSLVALVASFGGGPLGWALGAAALVPYILYTWLIGWAVPVGLARELLGRRGWAKTAREPLEANLPAPLTPPEAAAALPGGEQVGGQQHDHHGVEPRGQQGLPPGDPASLPQHHRHERDLGEDGEDRSRSTEPR